MTTTIQHFNRNLRNLQTIKMNELTKLLITFHESMSKLDADRKAVQLAMTENDIEKLVWNAAIDAAAEEAMLEIKDSKGVEIWSIVDAEIEGQFISSRITVSKESILNLKK